MRHKNIRRIIHRVIEEFKATILISKKTSIIKGIKTFIAKIDIQIMNRNEYKETPRIKKHLIEKHEIMMEYYRKDFHQFIENYNFNFTNNEKVKGDFTDKIWTCWWQGTDNAPEIVQKCIDSIKRNSKEHEVIVITDDNISKYIELPDWIVEKFKKGIISRTHLSDILRIELLSKYGGIWLDSTFYCVSNLDEYFNQDLWSIKRPDYGHASVASGYFANYSLGCKYEYRYIFSIIKDFLYEYWKKSNIMVDYLFLDYLICLACENVDCLNKKFSEIKNNNKNCDELFKKINSEYNDLDWNSMKEETKLFKLSWKSKMNITYNGKETFYSKILNGTLK